MAKAQRGATENLWSLVDENLIGSMSNYASRRFLQFGALGREVDTARDRHSGKMVVLKRVLLSRLVCSEVSILRRVKACTAKLLAVCPDPDWEERANQAPDGPPNSRYLCMVMQYGGRDIRHAMLSVPVQSTIHGILMAVAYLHHSVDVAHLDLKPENILMDDHGRVKVIDFGYATELDPDTGEGRLCHHCGTYGYQAPEIILGPHPKLKAADAWSVGCILLEMVVIDPDALYDLTGSVWPLSESPAKYLTRVVNLCGSIDESSFPGCSDLRRFARYKDYKLISGRENALKARLEDFVHPLPRDLISRLLTLDPRRRSTAYFALEHEFFARPANSPEVQRKRFGEPDARPPWSSRHQHGGTSNSSPNPQGCLGAARRRPYMWLDGSYHAETKPMVASHGHHTTTGRLQAVVQEIFIKNPFQWLFVILFCVLWWVL